ncbi:hypothetical protein CTI14_58185, partial [Methylobacterium radiotolerans]
TDLLRNAGLERALVDMGEIRGLDESAGATGWRVRLADPLSPEQILTQVPISNQALATSGGYGIAQGVHHGPRDGPASQCRAGARAGRYGRNPRSG